MSEPNVATGSPSVAALIRGGESPEQNQLAEMKANAERMDKIKITVDAGGTPSTEDAQFLKNMESGKQTVAAPETPAAGSGDNKLTQIDAVIAKLEKGETLSPEETAIAAEFNNLQIEEKVFKVGGKEYKENEILGELAKDAGVDPTEIASIPKQIRDKMVENHVTKMNKQSWEAASRERDQVNARAKKQMGQQMVQLMSDASKLSEQLEETEQLLQRVQALAGKQVDINDIYMKDDPTRIDPIKNHEVNKILNAREALPDLQERIKTLQGRSVQTERALVAQRFRDFQESNPEYATSIDVTQLAGQIGKGTLSEDEEIKLVEMIEIFQDADRLKTTTDVIHAKRLREGRLVVKPKQQAPTGGNGLSFTKNDTEVQQKILKSLKDKRNQMVIMNPSGSGAQRSSKTPAQQAVESIAASSRAMVSQSGEPSSAKKLAEDGW